MSLQLKITLDHSKPPIWRRILVPHHFTFAELHLTIQVAMGWANSHLYAFWHSNDSRDTIGMLFDHDWDSVVSRDSSKIKVTEDLYYEKQKMKYEYDFGDGWVHTIILEKITDDRIIGPKCLKGKMACPPEDCGGIRGYYDLLDKIYDPDYAEHEECREWLGLETDQVWLEEAFDLESCNQRVLHYKDYEVSWDDDKYQHSLIHQFTTCPSPLPISTTTIFASVSSGCSITASRWSTPPIPYTTAN